MSALATFVHRTSDRAVVGYGLVITLFTAGWLDRDSYDDSYFFKRMGLNLLDHGVMAWNVDEGPVYGSTSQLFQGLALLVTALSRDYYLLIMRVIAGLTLWLAFIFMRRLTRDRDRGLVATYAFCAPVLLYPVLSGMETVLAVLVLVAFLTVTLGRRASEVPFWVAPLLAAVVYTVRPDATLLALPVLWVARLEGQTPRHPWREVVLFSALLIAMLVAFRLYYGTALPLPFYAKQSAFSPYDEHFRQLSAQVREVRFGLFAACTAPLFALGACKRDRLNLTLLGIVTTFVAYHFFMTIDIMGMHARFYVPAMPFLILAAARGLGACRQELPSRAAGVCGGISFALSFGVLWLCHWLPSQRGSHVESLPLPTYFAFVFAALLLFASLIWSLSIERLALAILLATGLAAALPLQAAVLKLRSDDDYLALNTQRYTVYRGLDTLRACFGERIHVYHSEVGVPGLRFLNGKVSDMAGLLSRKWLFRTQSFDKICTHDEPEAIFLPHKVYRDLNREILAGKCIKRYQRVVAKSSSPLYVRRDLYDRFIGCATERSDPFVTLPKNKRPKEAGRN